MKKEDILETLSTMYLKSMDTCNDFMDLYIQADKNGNLNQARKIFSIMQKQIGIRDGIGAAANALGITTEELMLAVIKKA